MAANPPRGAMTSEDAHETLKIETYTSPVVDVSAATVGLIAGAHPALYFPDYAIGIRAARVIYKVAPTNTAGTLIIGTYADTDAVVASTTLSVVASIGDKEELTLASTLKNPAMQKSFGYPVLPKATVLVVTPGGGGSNAGDYILQIDYWRITPSRG